MARTLFRAFDENLFGDRVGLMGILGWAPGSIYYVDSVTGTSTGSGASRNDPLTTIDLANNKCSANRGDVICVMPGHSETLSATAGLALDIAGVTVLGFGAGRSKPALTAGAAAVDAVAVSAANVKLINLRVIGATSCTALLNVSAADLEVEKCVFEHGAAPVMAVTLASGADRPTFTGCKWLGTADGPDCAIDFEAHIADFIAKDCFFNYGVYGCDLGVLRSNVDGPEQPLIDNCIFVGVDTVAVDFNSSNAANVEGLILNCAIGFGADTANIDAGIDHGGCATIGTMGTDNVDSSGSRIPVQTPA